MPRQKNAVPSRRIRLSGYVEMPVTDPRVQVFLDWYDELTPQRKAFPTALSLLISALNGELGSDVQHVVKEGNTKEAIGNLKELLSAWKMDEDV